MEKIRAKVAIGGGPGTGKTSAALTLAGSLSSSWEKVTLIDATGQAPKLAGHSSLGPFKIDQLKGDGDFAGPALWIAALKRAVESGSEVAIVDTASDEWDWCLQQKDRLGGGFPVWKQITPEHNRFVRAIMRCPMHVISILRRKEKFRMSNDPGKKSEILSLGLRSEMRAGFERGMDLVIGLDSGFAARIEFDKTGKFTKNGLPIPIREVGTKVLAWTEGAKVDGER
jgi:hypothetical protein